MSRNSVTGLTDSRVWIIAVKRPNNIVSFIERRVPEDNYDNNGPIIFASQKDAKKFLRMLIKSDDSFRQRLPGPVSPMSVLTLRVYELAKTEPEFRWSHVWVYQGIEDGEVKYNCFPIEELAREFDSAVVVGIW